MLAPLFDKDILKILTVFSLSPGSRFLRKDVQEKTRLNNVSLDKGLSILLNSGLLKKEKRLLFLSLDEENTKAIIKLVSEQHKSLKSIPLDAYFSIIELVFFLASLKGLEAYLFGSYAKLVFSDNSDIDIAIISDELSRREKKEINRRVEKTEPRYLKAIELHYFSSDFYRNKKDPLVKEILRNGVRLL
jgi:predicted nucleotidyltransferase